MCELAYFYKVRRIFEEFVKLPPPFPSQDLFVIDIFGFNHGHGRKSCIA